MVSIIVAFYNAEAYLEELLTSIQNQTYKDFELIMMDDGSTDGSATVAEKILASCSFPHKLLGQANAGSCAARNAAFAQAVGEYVVFVDADDILSPDYLRRLVDDLEATGADFAACGYRTFSNSEEIGDMSLHDEEYELADADDIMHRYLYVKIMIPSWSVMTRSELIRKYDIRFAEGFNYCQGTHFVWRLLAHSHRVVLDPEVLYYYRVHPQAAMSKADESRLVGQVLMQNLAGYFTEHRPEFAGIFTRYGEARWVWGTLWQMACAMQFKEFKKICRYMNTGEMMKRLQDFPSFRVRAAARLFRLSPFLYYITARQAASLKGVNRINQ